MQPDIFDVFLSYTMPIWRLLKRLHPALRSAASLPWLDIWNLVLAKPFQEHMNRQFSTLAHLALFASARRIPGLGRPRNCEPRSSAEFKPRVGFRVIPVLLPGARKENIDIPRFLARSTWVVFKETVTEPAFETLISGIAALPPRGPSALEGILGL